MMGEWLARLKNEEPRDAYATKPTKPPQWEGAAGFVGFVAYPLASLKKIGAVDSPAVNLEGSPANDALSPDPASASDPDRWCWPHSVVWNSKEIDTFMARLARFTDKGLSYGDAERLADTLVIRDREDDGRRLCLECAHLHGAGRWRCGNWQAANMPRVGLARDLVLTLQQCPGVRRNT